MARGMSFHVGLNTVDPKHYDGWDGALAACEFDANDMESLAQSRGFETTKLLTGEATADAVLNGIDSALRASSSRVTSSSRTPATAARSRTGTTRRSTARTRPGSRTTARSSTTSRMRSLGKFQPGVRIVVLSDSCHSGSVNKGITNANPRSF